MNEQAYLAALEFSKAAIDREDSERMTYWLGICAERRHHSDVILSADYRARAIELLVKSCR